MKSQKYEIEALANEHCVCGENPLWDVEQQLFFWEDIPNGYVFRFDPKTGKHEKIYDGDVVGGFTFQEDGSLLLFRDHDFGLLNEDGTVSVYSTDVDAATGRFNDVQADPEGRVFAGTMGQGNSLSGGLFRVDLDGAVTKLFDGTGCSNGMGYTPDLKQMYWTDSTARAIYLFDYDRASGEIANRRTFYQCEDKAICPDGMTVDAEGCVWSAHWDGFAVLRFDPAGKLMEKIDLPVGKISSVTFGGENLDTLYLTSAGGTAEKGKGFGKNTADGTIYRVHVGVKGVEEFRSKIQTA